MIQVQGTSKASGPEEVCRQVDEAIGRAGLSRGFGRPIPGQRSEWRVSPEPFPLSEHEVAELEELGNAFLAFYRALNALYVASTRGRAPGWVAGYLDAGKPGRLLELGRMKRFRDDVPVILRPDLFRVGERWVATELDSVPGGFGILAHLQQTYTALGFPVLGGPRGVVRAFARALDALGGDPAAIVVSEESADYRPEMEWLAGALAGEGVVAEVLGPGDLYYAEDGVWLPDRVRRVRAVYRFFELFDLRNLPKIDLLLYNVRTRHVAVTPPFKPFLEEKLALGLFHHPALASYWRELLDAPTRARLEEALCPTWVVDPAPIPPHAVVAGFEAAGAPVQDWAGLKRLSQSQRRFVLKPSGFSPEAWGARGVTVGHDVSAEEWGSAVDQALAAFPEPVYVLQPFLHSRRFRYRHYDFAAQELREEDGRVRLCPYYFIEGDHVRLGGALATICPADKKVVHGMSDAVMVPAAIERRSNDEQH